MHAPGSGKVAWFIQKDTNLTSPGGVHAMFLETKKSRNSPGSEELRDDHYKGAYVKIRFEPPTLFRGFGGVFSEGWRNQGMLMYY